MAPGRRLVSTPYTTLLRCHRASRRPGDVLPLPYRLHLRSPASRSIMTTASRTSAAPTDAAVPEWLARTLNDSSPAPKIYRWTVDGGASPARVSRPPPVDQQRRIYVLGLGNLGRLFAAALARLPSRPPITLVVHRPALLQQWRANPGIVLHPPGYVEGSEADEDRITDFDVEMWSDSPPENAGASAEISAIANIVIATKAQDAFRTADGLRRYLGPASAVAFAQNGMNKLWPPYGALYNAARYPAPQRPPLWLACVVTHGVYSLGPFASVHAAPADVVLGAVDEGSSSPAHGQAYLVQQLLAAPQLNARWAPRHELWVLQLEKLVVNAVINPLTAILRCKNGALFVRPDSTTAARASDGSDTLPRIIDQLLTESSAVLLALARHEINTGSLFGQPSPEDAAALSERLSFASLRSMVYRVGHVVKDNNSSMFQDAVAGKPTEVGEFNGWVVEMARYLASVDATDGKTIDVAANQAMVDLVTKAVPLTDKELGAYFKRL